MAKGRGPVWVFGDMYGFMALAHFCECGYLRFEFSEHLINHVYPFILGIERNTDSGSK